MEGAEIVKAMNIHAQTTVLAADSSKYGKIGFSSVLPLSAMGLILTDRGLDSCAEAELREAGLSISTVNY